MADPKLIPKRTREQIVELIEFVETLPQEYRMATFEAIVGQVPMVSQPSGERQELTVPARSNERSEEAAVPRAADSPINPALKGFLARYGLDYNIVEAIAMQDGDNLVFYRNPEIKPKARATIEWSLLLALKRGITLGDFSVSKNEIREVCKENHCYDDGNFSKILREAKGLFSGPFSDSDTRRRLTPDGERELIITLKKLAGVAS